MILRPIGKVDVVIDTDTYNEVDDQFAIAYALRLEKLNIVEILAAPFSNARAASAKEGMEKSKEEIYKVLDLARREDMKALVYPGSESFLQDEQTPVDSEGVRKLISLAHEHTKENPLYVIGLAVLTNIASAILLDPSIQEKIVIIWLGGNSREFENTVEFNMKQDIASARVVFQSEARLVHIPCKGVASHFSTSKQELDYWLKGKNELATYLAENAITEASSYAEGKPWTRVIWDVTAIAWLINEDEIYLKERETKRNLPNYEGTYDTPKTDLLMNYVYYVNRDALFEDLFQKLTI